MTRGKSVAAADEPTSSGSRGVRLLSRRSNPGGLCRGRRRRSVSHVPGSRSSRRALPVGRSTSACGRPRSARNPSREARPRPGLEDPRRSRQMPHTARGGATRGATRAAASACRPGQLVRRRRGALGVEQRAVARPRRAAMGPDEALVAGLRRRPTTVGHRRGPGRGGESLVIAGADRAPPESPRRSRWSPSPDGGDHREGPLRRVLEAHEQIVILIRRRQVPRPALPMAMARSAAQRPRRCTVGCRRSSLRRSISGSQARSGRWGWWPERSAGEAP